MQDELTLRKGDADGSLSRTLAHEHVRVQRKMTQTVFLGVATVLIAIGSFLASIQHRYTAYSLFVIAVVMVGFALWSAYIEGTPKPHLVPLGYGYASENAREQGLVFLNDGDPAYKIEAPKPTRLGSSEAVLQFQEVNFSRLSKDGGRRCFPMSIREYDGRTIYSDLAAKVAIYGAVNGLSVSFRYADGNRPQHLRYTTTCRIIPIKGELHIELEKPVKFDWWKLF